MNRAFLMELSEEDDVAFKLLSDDFDIDGKVFLGSLNKCLCKLGEKGKVDNAIAVLSVDILQDLYDQMLDKNDILQVQSATDEVMLYLSEADRILRNDCLSLKLVAAVAYIRYIMNILTEVTSQTSISDVFLQHCDAVLSVRDHQSIMDKCRSQSVVVYFLRALYQEFGIKDIRAQFPKLQKRLPSFVSSQWIWKP